MRSSKSLFHVRSNSQVPGVRTSINPGVGAKVGGWGGRNEGRGQGENDTIQPVTACIGLIPKMYRNDPVSLTSYPLC